MTDPANTETHSTQSNVRHAFSGTISGAEIQTSELIAIIQRRLWVIIGSLLICTTIFATVSFQLAPRYTSSAEVLIDTRQLNTVDFQSVVASVAGEIGAIESEIQVITSRDMAGRIVDRLDLTASPEFNPKLQDPTIRDRVLSFILSWIPSFSLGNSATDQAISDLTDDDIARKERSDAISILLANLQVTPVGRSFVIKINYTSPDRELAVIVANTIADTYIVDQLDAKFESVRRVTDWLNDRLSVLREKVRESDQAVANYREQAGIVSVDSNTSLVGQQLAQLNAELAVARAERSRAEAELNQIQREINSGRALDTIPEVLSSPLIQSLRSEEATLQRQFAELSSRYGEKHPRVQDAEAELANARDKILSEVQKIASNLRSAVSVARSKERSLQQSLNEISGQQTDISRSEVRLRELERQADADRALYEAFLERFKQTSEQETFQQPDARLISQAEGALQTYPPKALIIGFGILIGAFLGILLALLVERMQKGVQSADQLERLTGLSVLSVIPTLRALSRTGIDSKVVDTPTAAYSEAIRAIRTGISLAAIANPVKVVQVTSAIPGEAKTTTALALARSSALSGVKTLLIECDLRRFNLHNRLGNPDGSDLIEILDGMSNNREMSVTKDDLSPLHIIPVHTRYPNPADLLSSDRFAHLMELAKQKYDLIILDSPPLIPVNDARLVSPLVDYILMVVRFDSTERKLIEGSVKQLKNDGNNRIGMVLSRANLKKLSKYSGSHYTNYYGRYKEYY